MENVWLRRVILHYIPMFNFLQDFFSTQCFDLAWWRTINKHQTYVVLLIKDYYCDNASFDFSMYKGAHDVFTLVIFFGGFDLRPKHVTFSLFEVINATKTCIGNKLD